MSIFPATDLVTEVAKAADPSRRNAAVVRLSEMSNTSPGSVDGFANLVADNRKPLPAVRPTVVASPIATSRSAAAASPSARPVDAAQKFEAFIIQSCLETMLPKTEGGSFGHGTAGEVWRSMVAEQIGDQIAKSGGLGLRKLLEHDLTTRAKLSTTS
ncbi:rod-binding protein [Methylosinus sp. H3A]|uniref:rod-binding protein n=1 Tax=Methylosinus sp. H3A TaxID=2785786 RepID=UPI0018C1D21C|nr:rod-binding protein [Methylosinus sp. H3A]MBG0808612.1 rod-binding protein [Methylosinus sp. H3A]